MHDNDDDDENTINAGGGTEIPKRRQTRQGQRQRFGVIGGNNDNSGEGDCNGCSDDESGDMVMRLQH